PFDLTSPRLPPFNSLLLLSYTFFFSLILSNPHHYPLPYILSWLVYFRKDLGKDSVDSGHEGLEVGLLFFRACLKHCNHFCFLLRIVLNNQLMNMGENVLRVWISGLRRKGCVCGNDG
ncbi:hypothetical protein V8G54_026277, partial [Vigna mungo]